MDKTAAWGALEMGALRVLIAVGISAAAYKLISPKGKSAKPLDSARRGVAWGTFSALTTTLPDVLHDFSPQSWLKLAVCLIASVIFGFLVGFTVGSIKFRNRKPKVDESNSETEEKGKAESFSTSVVIAQVGGDIYTTVADEIESKNVDRGVWARAFAEANGDADKTKAAYIRLRVNQSGGIKSSPTNQLSGRMGAAIVGCLIVLGIGGYFLLNRPTPEALYAAGMKLLELKEDHRAGDIAASTF